MWLLSAGDCRPFTSRAAGMAGGQDLPGDELHGAHFALDPGFGAKNTPFARHPVDLLAGQVEGDEGYPAGGFESRGIVWRIEYRRVAGGVAGHGGPVHAGRGVAARRRRIKVRFRGARTGSVAGRACGVRPVVGLPARGVDQRLVGCCHLAEGGGVPAVVRMGFACGPAVGHLDLLVGGCHRDAEHLVVGAAALGQAPILFRRLASPRQAARRAPVYGLSSQRLRRPLWFP